MVSRVFQNHIRSVKQWFLEDILFFVNHFQVWFTILVPPSVMFLVITFSSRKHKVEIMLIYPTTQAPTQATHTPTSRVTSLSFSYHKFHWHMRCPYSRPIFPQVTSSVCSYPCCDCLTEVLLVIQSTFLFS